MSDPSCSAPSYLSSILYRSQAADLAARDQLHPVLEPLIRQLAGKRCKALKLDPSYIDDAVQETFLRILSPTYVRFDPKRGAVEAYLSGIVWNCVRDQLPHQSETMFDEEEHDNLARADVHEADYGSALPVTPESAVAAAEELSKVTELTRGILVQFPAAEQEVAIRRACEEQTFPQIAEELGISRFKASRQYESFLRAAKVMAMEAMAA